MSSTVVLIHSPLVGPVTWSLVAQEIQSRGVAALTPEIHSHDNAPVYWQRDAGDVARALEAIPSDRELVLVGHSGAGLLLPAIRQMIPNRVAGYVFVDAGIPVDGMSRLDLIRQESAELADDLQSHLESGGRFPEWTGEQLEEIVPDANLRAELIADLRPQPLRFFTEPIPVYSGWPDAPCRYIQFTPGYDMYAQRARTAGWPVTRLDGGHFHMLVDPESVMDAILRSSALDR